MASNRVRILSMLAVCALAAIGLSHLIGTPSAALVAANEEVTKRGYADDEVRILFCTSCGFKQNFMEVKNFLEDKYPHLVDRVYGANYDVDPMKKFFAQFLGYAQIVGMVLMVFGEQIFRAMGWDTTLLQKALDNRIGCFALILLVGSVSQGLISTGAFEVFYNDELVFSKLQSGRWPTLDELAQLLEAKGISDIY